MVNLPWNIEKNSVAFQDRGCYGLGSEFQNKHFFQGGNTFSVICICALAKITGPYEDDIKLIIKFIFRTTFTSRRVNSQENIRDRITRLIL